MTETRAFWVTAAGVGELRAEQLAGRTGDQVEVETLASGISRGTEALVFLGRVPSSQHATMRAPFQAGDFGFPIKYGYSAVGEVVGGLIELQGQRVFCLHPHQDRFIVPADAVLPLPGALPTDRAVLAANMETALNGLWDAAPRLGERIAVVGAGVVGALVAALAAGLPGAQVQLIDIDPAKAGVAAAMGVDFALPDTADREVDLVVHTSGSVVGLQTALQLGAFEATILELSWYGDQTVEVPLGEAFHSRRLTLRSSQVGSIATSMRARWSHRRRLALALDLLLDPRFDALLEPAIAFDRLPAEMPEITRAAGRMCQVVHYPSLSGRP